uniref:Universal stress protein n=1 Tax=candidate division WOR-3 bacterium TaxID=2052148 RepID=A0A7C6ECL4_UNCW3
MLEKLLLYVEDSAPAKALANWTLKLAKVLNARIFVVFVINQKKKTKNQLKNQNQEETAWAILYEIEDDAFEANVKVSLILEEGRPEDKLIEVLTSFELDGIIISRQSRIDFSSLLGQMPKDKVIIIK